jgi:hypothetical protein
LLNNIIFSVNAVFPLVVLMFLGFCLKQERVGLFKNPREFFGQVERLVFNVALPVLLFRELSGMNAENIFELNLVVYCVLGILVLVMLLSLLVPVFIKNKPARGAFIQGVSRPNFAFLGVPIAHNLAGELGSNTAALILPFAVVMFNILAVVILTVHADPDNNNREQQNAARRIITGIIKNPLIISIAIAMPVMLFQIPLPFVMRASVNHIANMSTPLALISLGAGIDLQILKNKIKLPLIASVMRTVICPLVFVVPAVLLGFRDAALVVIFVLFASPTAVSSYIMAKNMNSDYELAGQIVALTTVICPVTVFAGSFILKSLELI